MDICSGTSDTEMTGVRVGERLGLGGAHAAWLRNLDEPQQVESLIVPSSDALSLLLGELNVAADDAAEVIRSMPRAERDPELRWLVERTHHLLAGGLANRTGLGAPPPALPQGLPEMLRLFPVHLILVTLDAIRGCQQQFGIPDDVSWETLSHLGRAMAAYRASHGQAGIELSRWDWLRFLGVLYQVGRLEVIPYRLCTLAEAGPLFWYDDEAAVRLGRGFRKGDPALSVHVPATDPLTPEACNAAFDRMRTAFAGVYPGEPPRVATCTSWLLDDQLAEYLPADSNILAFARRFALVPGSLDNDEAILGFVFGAGRARELDALPQRTTLERAVVRHIQSGRHWRLRTGWLELAG